MGQALYRTHRPKKLSEVVGQEHITQTLQQALEQGRISHAYLFTGPRGVGKTSIARILAHEINELPYEDDSAHLDIIEIDAASNRRIDEIRELRDKVYVAPTSAKYKVYIIDEVHMLTREAFNALLKTLEEPPAHVVFILATTDAHKLPETIISRTQRYSFRPVEKAKVVDHLRAIAQEEKITVSDEALQLLAEHGEGSFRDSISLLDQASSQGTKLELEDVQTLLGIPPTEGVHELLAKLSSSATTSAALMQQLNNLYEQGYQATAITKQLMQQLRQQLIAGTSPLPAARLTALLARLLEVPPAYDPERFLELVLLETLSTATSEATPAPALVSVELEASTVAAPSSKAAARHNTPVADEPVEAKTVKTVAPPPKNSPETTTKPPADPAKAERAQPTVQVSVDQNLWPQVLNALKQQYNTLYGVVRMAEPTFGEDGRLTLAFAFAFHQKRLNDTKHRQILADIIKQLSGQTVRIDCIVDKTVQQKPALPAAAESEKVTEVAPDNNELSTISNIFGGGELLE